MSAFIMPEEGFKQLATELNYHKNYNYQHLQWAVQRFLGNDSVACRVQQLYEANVRAVNQRYSDDTPVTDLKIRVNGSMPQWSPFQLFKHLECLSYQMAEGDVPDSPIYKDLETLTGDIAKSILMSSDKWEKAKWGW